MTTTTMRTAAGPKERPILFNAEMVRALLREDNPKTQTRRLRGLDLVNEVPGAWQFDRWQEYPDGSLRAVFDHIGLGEANAIGLRCPYGRPGDRLWVRENWGVGSVYDGMAPRDVHTGAKVVYPASGGCVGVRIRPSIHMPRWASRTLLEVVSVRPEQVHEISEADAIAEGVARSADDRYWLGAPHPVKGTPKVYALATFAFRDLWDSINASRGHPSSRGSWVWRIEFRRIEEAAHV